MRHSGGTASPPRYGFFSVGSHITSVLGFGVYVAVRSASRVPYAVVAVALLLRAERAAVSRSAANSAATSDTGTRCRFDARRRRCRDARRCRANAARRRTARVGCGSRATGAARPPAITAAIRQDLCPSDNSVGLFVVPQRNRFLSASTTNRTDAKTTRGFRRTFAWVAQSPTGLGGGIRRTFG